MAGKNKKTESDFIKEIEAYEQQKKEAMEKLKAYQKSQTNKLGQIYFELKKQKPPISVLSEYFDGTFYLDPEDYEEELTPCTSFLENDSHISTVWEEEHSKTEKINSTSISPLVKFNKDSDKDGELRFSYNFPYSIENQYLKDYAA